MRELIKANKFKNLTNLENFQRVYKGVGVEKYHQYLEDFENVYGLKIEKDLNEDNKWIFSLGENSTEGIYIPSSNQMLSNSSETGIQNQLPNKKYYVCYFWNELKRNIDDGHLTIFEDTKKAYFKMNNNIEYNGPSLEDSTKMISCILTNTSKIGEINHLTIHFDRSTNAPMMFASFSGVNLQGIRGAMSGSAIIERVDSFDIKSPSLAEFAYYFLYHKLSFHKPVYNTDFFTDPNDEKQANFHIINSWKIFNDKIKGYYSGYRINTATEKFERFSMNIESTGKAELYFPGRGNASIKGQCIYMADKQMLIGRFDYQRRWDNFGYRFVINCDIDNLTGWNNKGIILSEESASKITSSRIIIKKNEEGEKLTECKSWNLGELPRLSVQKNEDKLIRRFFVGDDDRKLTDSTVLFDKMKYIDYPMYNEESMSHNLDGDYTTHSLSRKNDNLGEGKVTPNYYIEVHPIKIEGNQAIIKCGKTQREHHGKILVNNNILIININTNGFVFNAVYSLLADVNSTLDFTYGVSARINANTGEPTARAEVLYRIQKGSSYGEVEAREVKIDMKDEAYIQISKSKRGLTEFIAGRLNRLILLNRDNKPNEAIKSRKDEFRKIYFHQSVYFAMRGQVDEAERSLIVSYFHGFGNYTKLSIDKLPSWCEADQKLLVEELEHFKGSKLLIDTILKYWGDYLSHKTKTELEDAKRGIKN
jgi:hypothetical protein